MKRQAKPFAVEIKRSRRSTPLNEHSNEPSGIDQAPKKLNFFKLRPDELLAAKGPSKTGEDDLRIPVFLQATKENEHQNNLAEITAVYPPLFLRGGKDQDQRSQAPRILPCLSSEEEPKSLELKSPEKTREHLNRSAPLIFVKPPESTLDDAVASPSLASEENSVRLLPVPPAPPVQISEFVTDIEPTHSDPLPKKRAHRFLKVDRESAASLPPGQRWKRRMLTRAR